MFRNSRRSRSIRRGFTKQCVTCATFVLILIQCYGQDWGFKCRRSTCSSSGVRGSLIREFDVDIDWRCSDGLCDGSTVKPHASVCVQALHLVCPHDTSSQSELLLLFGLSRRPFFFFAHTAVPIPSEFQFSVHL
jgi:hypothetical protein